MFTTLARRRVNVADKGFRGTRNVCTLEPPKSKRRGGGVHTLRRDEKSAQLIDKQRVESLPLCTRVRNSLKRKGIVSGTRPKWVAVCAPEECPPHPGVFVRVANAGLTGYGTWKSLRRMAGRGVRERVAGNKSGRRDFPTRSGRGNRGSEQVYTNQSIIKYYVCQVIYWVTIRMGT